MNFFEKIVSKYQIFTQQIFINNIIYIISIKIMMNKNTKTGLETISQT